MFDVGPTLGANITHLSRTKVPWVGSTSGATVVNVSNIDVFEVGTNIVLLSWNSLRELPHSTNVSQDRGFWLFLPARAWDIILGSGREQARAKKSSSLHSVCLGSLKLERNWIWLDCVRRWAVSLVTDYFFIQFYVSAIFHNDWTPEMKRWKERLFYNFNSVQLPFNQCVFNRIQYRTEHNLYHTRLDKVDRMKSSTRSVQFSTAWRMETQQRLYIMKSCSFHFSLSTSTFHFHFHFPGN